MAEDLNLPQALEGLRSDLETAWRSGESKPVRFDISEVTLVLETVARIDKEGSGQIRWWLVGASAGARSGDEQTQTLTLKLEPYLHGQQGSRRRLAVAADQPMPKG